MEDTSATSAVFGMFPCRIDTVLRCEEEAKKLKIRLYFHSISKCAHYFNVVV